MRISFSAVIIFLLIGDLFAQQNKRIYINEFLASNVTVNSDIVDFDDYSDWIELYNDEENDVNIGGYFITDNLNQPSKYKFPPDVIIPSKSYLVLWADGYDDIPGKTYRRDYFPYPYFTTKYFHLSFSLSRAGEEIALFNADTVLLDEVHFDLQERDVSMGRKPGGGNNWYYFGDPTPGDANLTEGTLNLIYAGEPQVSVNSGFYNSTQTISITTGAPDYTIKYTLDGTRPDLNSETYSAPLTISKTTVLRARIYEPGKLPGRIHTFNYFINEPTDLAVISLAASPETLFGDEKGIYDNQFKSREIPVNIQYFEPDRSQGFLIDAGLRMTGQASLDYPQKSFTINTDAGYGQDIIDYQVFPERNINSYTELYLRNAGVPDNRLTMFRDGLLQNLVLNKIDVDCQAYKPAALFINGQYWGIYNIREKIGSAYLASMNNINPDDIDLLEFNQSKIPDAVEGSEDEFIELLTFFEQNDLSVSENYEYINSKIDIEEYINYYITEIYYDNIFWLNQNVRIWKERKEGRKWRWILYDTDNSFGAEGPGTSRYQTNTLHLATSDIENNVYPLWSTLTFRKLLANEEFKIKFIQKFASYINTVFHPDTVLKQISQHQTRIAAEMQRHIPRWNTGGIINGLPPIRSFSEWDNNVRKMKQFAASRPMYQRQHIIDVFGLSGSGSISLSIDDPGNGKVVTNNTEITYNTSSGTYFKDIPIELKAVPEVGFRFVRWKGIADEYSNPVNFTLVNDSLNITAEFEPAEVSTVPAEITENLTLIRSGSPYYAKGNITVAPHALLTIESGVRILMPEKGSVIVSGKLMIRGTKEDPVIIEPNENSEKWGALCFVNASDSSVVENAIIKGAAKGVDFSRDRGAISSYNSKLCLDGVVVENVEAPVFIQLGSAVIKNCRLHTASSGDLINIKRADYALTENCDLMGNDAFDSDAIDYDQIKTGVIRGNKIYNIYGFNSDGIDLGEDSKNILIENNLIYNVNDKGVSIGNASTGIIKRNVIANCDQGVGIKDYGSYGYIEHNTFYANNHAVACFEKNIGEGGGSADVVNSIIADSKTSPVFVDALSEINISFSLSNTQRLEGMQNLNADPLLLNDLYLSFGSPAINKGNPALPYDPDGSIADLGAYPFNQYRQTDLIINEIHYNPKNGNIHPFVEIVNAGKTSVNLSSITLGGDIICRFGNETISAGEYFIAAKDKSLYEGQGYKVFQWESGELRNIEGNILLADEGNVLDFVNYDSRYWWPKEPDGSGPSLGLHNTQLENMISFSWRSSNKDGGTPGRANNSDQLTNIFINEFMAGNTAGYADEKGEFDDWIELYNNNDFPVNIAGLYLTDDLQKRGKFLIPFHSAQQTTIPAKGHILFWADEQSGQGILHMNFKLEKSGEFIGLTQVIDGDTLFIDSLTYPVQSENISYGRLPDGSENWSSFSVPTPRDTNKVLSGISDDDILPSYSLSQNYPNPFNPATIIKWQTAQQGVVTLKIYDILGREVITLVNEFRPAGRYETEFRADQLSSGIYIYRLKSGRFVQTKKMLLLR